MAKILFYRSPSFITDKCINRKAPCKWVSTYTELFVFFLSLHKAKNWGNRLSVNAITHFCRFCVSTRPGRRLQQPPRAEVQNKQSGYWRRFPGSWGFLLSPAVRAVLPFSLLPRSAWASLRFSPLHRCCTHILHSRPAQG